MNGLILVNPLLMIPKDRRMSYLKNLFITKIIGVLFGDFYVNSFLNPTSMFSIGHIKKYVHRNQYCKLIG